MNAQFFHHAGGLDHATQVFLAWIVGLCSLTVYAAFAPYVAHDQARQLVVCLGGLSGLFLLSKTERIRKKIAHVKDLHWAGLDGSAA